MKATDFAPVRPLSCTPDGLDLTYAQARAALLDALRGATLGTHDLAIVSWAAGLLDAPTVRVLVSWLERARRAGQVDALEAMNDHLVAAGHHTAAEIARGRAHDLHVGRWTPDDTRAGGR